MARRSANLRRSQREWVIRGLLATALVVLGYITVTQTLALSVQSSDVMRAHALSPRDGRITALAAHYFAGVNASSSDRIKSDQFARMALRQDPTAVTAASTLGMNAQIRGDTSAARRAFHYAETLSRRDLETQLWAIEDSVGRGDVTGALRHYDTALRTSRGAPDLLYPILAAAIVNPNVRGAMVRTLAARPPWGGFFIDFVSGNGADARSTASLFVALRRAGIAISDDADATIINTLATRASMADAWQYYAASHLGVDRRTARDSRFVRRGTPSLFDWVPSEEPGLTVTLQTAESGGVLDFSGASGMGGVLVRQVQLLPPGRYRLAGHGEGLDQEASARPYWTLTCRNDGREVGRVATTAAADGGRFFGVIDVPPNCSTQILALMAPPSDAVSGLSGQIDRLELRPIGVMRTKP